MRMSQVRNTLEFLLGGEEQQIITPFLRGFPGIGKSAVVHQLVEKYEYELIDLRLSQHDVTDVKGTPYQDPTTKTTIWFTPEFMPVEGNPKYEGTKGILFFDEVNRAHPDVIQSVFEIVHDFKVGGHPIAKGWKVVCAGNLGDKDGNDTVEFDTALKDRFLFLDLDVKTLLKDWMLWAKAEGKIHPDIISFIDKKPGYLYYGHNDSDMKENQKSQEGYFVTPRRWHKFSRMSTELNKAPIEVLSMLANPLFHYSSLILDLSDHLQEIVVFTAKDIHNRYKTLKKKVIKARNNSREVILAINEDLIELYKVGTLTKKGQENIADYVYDVLEVDQAVAWLTKILKTSSMDNLIELLDIFESKYPNHVFCNADNLELQDEIGKAMKL